MPEIASPTESKSFISDALNEYIAGVSRPEPEILARLRAETSSHPQAQMQITAAQGVLFAVLVKALRATRTLEIGVFTGYSSLAVALALPPEGRITALDISEEYTQTARRYWAEAGVTEKIDLRIGPAVDSLDALIRENAEGTFDFAFIDADKEAYTAYLERSLKLVRKGGLLAFDNTLQHGRVADPSDRQAQTEAIRGFNAAIARDPRVLSVLLPVADGLTLAVKL